MLNFRTSLLSGQLAIFSGGLDVTDNLLLQFCIQTAERLTDDIIHENPLNTDTPLGQTVSRHLLIEVNRGLLCILHIVPLLQTFTLFNLAP